MTRNAQLISGLLLFMALSPRRPARAESHPVFDLIANRTLAHVERNGGLWLGCGTPGFVRYTHFGRPSPTWHTRAVEDGIPVALAGAAARLDVPLSAEQLHGRSVFLRLKAQSRSSVKIAAEGKTSAAVPLGPGWQTVEVPLPEGALHPGENTLDLTFAQNGHFSVAGGQQVKAAAAVAWIQIGGTAPDAASSAAPPQRLMDGERLVVPGGGALYYYVQLPAGAALSVKGEGEGCKLGMSVEGGQKRVARDLPQDGSPVDLGGPAGELRRIGLHAQGSCAGYFLTSAQLLTAGPAAEVHRDKKPRNVLFWLTDDTRADRYRLWNPKSRVETPVVDAFSQRATRFAVAYVQGNESRVSHASLFTGMYPAQHKFIAHNAVLSSSFEILPEVMHQAGLYTVGHIANGYISKRWGFGDGWDVMHNYIHEGGGLRAGDLVVDAQEFLQKGPGTTRPFFLYLGTIDAHVSWRAYEPWISKYDGKGYTGPFVRGCMDPQLDKIVGGTLPITPRDKERIAALYDCDISYNDAQFGALLEILRKDGKLEDTMIVFTSDHGEEFWDHGKIGHGQSLRQELVHVPMLISYPPLFPPGKVVEEGVELLDLLPTLADALGVKVPAAVQGESLIGLAQGQGAGYPRPAISSQYELAHTMRLGRWKLWVGGSGQMKLYDGQADLKEEHDLIGHEPLAQRFVSDALGLWMAYQDRWKKARWGVASNQRPEFAQDLEK